MSIYCRYTVDIQSTQYIRFPESSHYFSIILTTTLKKKKIPPSQITKYDRLAVGIELRLNWQHTSYTGDDGQQPKNNQNGLNDKNNTKKIIIRTK